MSLHLFIIDEELRAVLHELETYLHIKLDKAVVNKIFVDAEDYSQGDGEKCYTLYRDSNAWFSWIIEGVVEEYEPETIWLQSRFGFHRQKQFEAFFKNRT